MTMYFCPQDLVDTYQYVQQFPAAFAPLRGQFNFDAISELYNTTDFIGISSYPSLTPNFQVQQLEAATEQFDFEVGQFGVNLRELVVQQVSVAQNTKSEFSQHFPAIHERST